LISWLAEHEEEKVLLICQTRNLVEEIYEAVQKQVNLNLSQFHEGLNLIQRDRQAAYFADPKGARVLLCSEIGSEGRNFQFAHHLILWDLPENPELCGTTHWPARPYRPDRYHPYSSSLYSPIIRRSMGTVLQQGVGIFNHPVPTALILAHQFGEKLDQLCMNLMQDALQSLNIRNFPDATEKTSAKNWKMDTFACLPATPISPVKAKSSVNRSRHAIPTPPLRPLPPTSWNMSAYVWKTSATAAIYLSPSMGKWTACPDSTPKA
jgi:hypothetical protein